MTMVITFRITRCILKGASIAHKGLKTISIRLETCTSVIFVTSG